MMDDNKKNPTELNLCSVKEFLWFKGGKCKYSELFDHFRGSITESEHDEKFQEFISNIAVKKYDESNDEWICLKKKFQDPANAHSGFFASTFQKTKNNLSKLSNKAFMKDKENKMNTSGANLSASDSSPRRSSSLMSLGYVESEETGPGAKIGMSQSMQSLNSTIVDEQAKSVKEQARELNRKNTESELKLRGQNMSESKLSLGKSGVRLNKHVEVEYFDFSDPQPCEKEWILVCSSGDYMQIAKLLFKQPYLAQKKDPFNTVVHWACKYGNLDLLKLVASTLENDNKTNPRALRINHLINTRTGYTCLHIAYMYNHSELVPYLKTYGAEPLTDYNGKNGIDYSHAHSHFEHHLAVNMDESKSPDVLNDASNLVKRSNSALVGKEKEKDDLGFCSVKGTDNRRIRPKIVTTHLADSPFRRNQQILAHSSPLNPIEQLMPPPKSTSIQKSKTNIKNQLDESHIMHESKENFLN